MVLRQCIAVVIGLIGIVGLSACSDSPTSPTNNAPYSQLDLLQGTGTDAQAGKVIRVHYTGWFFDESVPSRRGVQFDSSTGGEPFLFTLGVGQVIPGWDQGLVGMRVGGIRRLVVPPSLAYGGIRNTSIPPNATLLFEVELLEVQ
jgi:FKBP-type peptidyl-prolyl cis-trans isomerase FkpA